MPPGSFEDTRFFFFFLRADRAHLQGLCDRYFNERAEDACVRYDALGVVVLAFSHVHWLTSAQVECGAIRYKDIAFWVPVWGGSEKTGRHLCLFPPFIFVDEPATMVTGRELFGLPKQMGKFVMPEALEKLMPTQMPEFSADVRGTLQPGGPVDWRRLVEVRHRPGIGGKVSTAAHDVFHRMATLLDHGPGVPGLTLPEGLGTLRALGLKQIRSANDPLEACYQAIVEAPLETVKVHDFSPLLDDFEVTLCKVPSHPVADVLGLHPGPRPASLAVYLRATMRMQLGQTIWSSS